MIDSLFMHYYNSKMFEIFLLSFFSPNRIKQLLQMHRLNFVEQDIFCILLNYLTWWNNNWCAAGSLGKAANSFLSRKFPASRTQVLKKKKKSFCISISFRFVRVNQVKTSSFIFKNVLNSFDSYRRNCIVWPLLARLIYAEMY